MLRASLLVFAILLAACGARPGLDPDQDGQLQPDAGTAVDAAPMPDVAVVDAYQPPTCTLPAPNSSVQGTTPIGEIDLPYAFAGLTGGECAEGLLLFAFEVDTVSWDHPHPNLELRSTPGPLLGMHEVEAWINMDGAWEGTTGIVEVTAFDDWWSDPTGHVHAQITIVGDGWDITGEVDAPYCDALMMWCI